jgi:hypothetical protein
VFQDYLVRINNQPDDEFLYKPFVKISVGSVGSNAESSTAESGPRSFLQTVGVRQRVSTKKYQLVAAFAEENISSFYEPFFY